MDTLDTKRKALKINLNPQIYGTFAEIGAGQEVSRNFFMAGAASGTVAKSMSAYDMAFSDAIYGAENGGRYVAKSRLERMLDHEYNLLPERLQGEKYEGRTYFAFANTVTTLNYKKTNEAHGWVGIRFQLTPDGPPNEILFHVRMLDSDASLQQQVLGVLGVNLVYAAFYHHANPDLLIKSLADNLSFGAVEIDMISVWGDAFAHTSNLVLNMMMIAKGYCRAAIFGSDGNVCHPKDLLYKKDVIIYRRRYKQKTPINREKMTAAIEFIKKNEGIADENLVVLTEITLNNTLAQEEESINLQESLARVQELLNRKRTVMVSNFDRNNKPAQFIIDSRAKRVCMLLSIANLASVFDSTRFGPSYTRELLEYVSNLFSENVQVYAFPHQASGEAPAITTKNMPTSPDARALFDFLLQNRYVLDVE